MTLEEIVEIIVRPADRDREFVIDGISPGADPDSDPGGLIMDDGGGSTVENPLGLELLKFITALTGTNQIHEWRGFAKWNKAAQQIKERSAK
jgi:hypothetical protein